MPVERNSTRVIDLRRTYCNMVSEQPDKDILFLDETGFNLHTSINCGYSPIGQPAFISLPANRGRNLSLIVTISAHGLISYTIYDGPVNGEMFTSYLELDLLPRLQGNEVAIILDNAKIHHVGSVSKWAEENEIRLEYLPPYSPQLNPVENLFSCIKMRVNSFRPRPETTRDLRASLISILNDLVDEDFGKYFKKMRDWIKIGRKGEIYR